MSNNPGFSLGPKHAELIEQYKKMAEEGYDTIHGDKIETAFSDFELRRFRNNILPVFQTHNAKTVLDYGCGGSDWTVAGFHENQSALDYFGLEEAFRFEPARGMDERREVDIVTCFDVLEHVFISDVPATLMDIFSYAKKAVILNVACYKARATLPTGENAHISVRAPLWWKGCVDTIATLHPDIDVTLFCSNEYTKVELFPSCTVRALLEGPGFER